MFSLFGSLGRLGGLILGFRVVILGTCGTKWDQVWEKSLPTRDLGVILFGAFFEALAAAASKKCKKAASGKNTRQGEAKSKKLCSFLEGRICDPYTPAQSKHIFSISSF